MKLPTLLRALGLFAALPLLGAEAPTPPIVNDTALRIELLVSTPDVEACTTVCGAPDGSFYVGNDPRDGRLSTSQPVNQIVRFSSMGAEKKRTVFADKIFSPAGSAWHDGYLYVLHDPLLTRFKDTDGDGIADVREDLVTNLGIPPNEGLNDHVVSGFTLGMDGFWYISVGDRGIYQAKSTRDGATFKLVSDTKLIEPEKGADFRPMQLSVAADGSLLIADWGYGGWKSPKVAGAIWRLSWPEAKPAPRLKDESKATVEELIAALGHPDRDQRLRAQWALIGKGNDALGAVMLAAESSDAPILERIHALWALERIPRSSKAGEKTNEALNTPRRYLSAPEVELRLQAIRMSGLGEAPDVPMTYDALLKDPDARVRAQAAIAIRAVAMKMDARPRVEAVLRGILAMGAKPLLDRLSDPDAWVRFTARQALRKVHHWKFLEDLLVGSLASDPAERRQRSEEAWQTITGVFDSNAVQLLTRLAGDKGDGSERPADMRRHATAALGRIAYQPTPYDGHWWGTQPVKSPPPQNSVAWAGTPQALAALTAALSDPDTGVRLAAAKAFSQFIMPAPAPAAAPRAAAAAFSPTVDGFFTDRRRLCAPPSSASSATVDTFLPTVGGRRTPKKPMTVPQKPMTVPQKAPMVSGKPTTLPRQPSSLRKKPHSNRAELFRCLEKQHCWRRQPFRRSRKPLRPREKTPRRSTRPSPALAPPFALGSLPKPTLPCVVSSSNRSACKRTRRRSMSSARSRSTKRPTPNSARPRSARW
jgi:HEAT repeat protein